MIAGRLAGRLIRLACLSLPEPDRAARRREWTAEAAAILDDPQTRPRARRSIAALLFAADQLRGARRIARHAPLPLTGSRSAMYVVWPCSVLVIASPVLRWLPAAHPVRLALYELVLAAGMICQVIRERRHWLAGSKDLFDQPHGRARRRLMLNFWSIVAWDQITVGIRLDSRLDALLAGAGMLVTLPILCWFVEPRIFAWPSSAQRHREG